MESKRIETFDNWKDTFQAWQRDINYDTKLFASVLQSYEFSDKFAYPKQVEIGFDEFVLRRSSLSFSVGSTSCR